jgi:hypothetical protein
VQRYAVDRVALEEMEVEAVAHHLISTSASRRHRS